MGVKMENDNPRTLAARKVEESGETGKNDVKSSRFMERMKDFLLKKPLAESVAVIALSAGVVLGATACGGPDFEPAWGPDNQDASVENDSNGENKESGKNDTNLDNDSGDSISEGAVLDSDAGEASLMDNNVPDVIVVPDSSDASPDIVETGFDVLPDIGPEPMPEASVETGPDMTITDVVNDQVSEESGQPSPWQYKVVCTITTGLPLESDLPNFPAYCTLDSAGLIASEKMKNDCTDIRVDGLSYEIEAGTCNTSNTVIWLKLPLARGGPMGNPVDLLYGNPAAVDGQDVQGVWSNGYSSVWHLSNTADSIGTNNLTITGTANFGTTNCKFGKCAELTPASFFSKASAVHPTGANPSTFSCWGMTTTVNTNMRMVGAFGQRSYNHFRDIYAISSTNVGVVAENYGASIQATLNGQIAGFYSTSINFFASTYTGTNYSVFLNSAHNGTTGTLNTQSGALWLGLAGGPSTEAWAQTTNGYLDECRLSNVARSDLWMKAEYSVTFTNGNEGPNN